MREDRTTVALCASRRDDRKSMCSCRLGYPVYSWSIGDHVGTHGDATYIPPASRTPRCVYSVFQYVSSPAECSGGAAVDESGASVRQELPAGRSDAEHESSRQQPRLRQLLPSWIQLPGTHIFSMRIYVYPLVRLGKIFGELINCPKQQEM